MRDPSWSFRPAPAQDACASTEWSETQNRAESRAAHVGGGRRRVRVTVLLAGILTLSVSDLVMTLTNLHTTGMAEANPIARLIIEHSSSLGLVAYKLITVSVCLALLYRLRNSIQSEIASWVGIAILAGLSVYWGHYSAHMHDADALEVRLAGDLDERWLTLAE